MPTALYRISSGEVVKISLANQTWPQVDSTFWAVLTDPALPDGTQVIDDNGDLRVLGFAKFADVGGDTVRNATQPEIDTFAPAQTEDENQQDADGADSLFIDHPRWRQLYTAYSDIIKDEMNILRGWITQFKADVAAANNLADLKTSVAAQPDLPDRTLAQLKTAIRTRIDKDD